MNPNLMKELLFIGLFVVANCIIAAPLIKIFAKRLTLKQAFYISIVAFAPTSIALAAYFIAKLIFGFPRELDGLVTMLAIAAAGIIITARIKSYGIRKLGFIGVGAKTAITLVIVSWLLFAVNLTNHILF